MKIYLNHKSTSAFTFIELIVVIVLMSTISIILFLTIKPLEQIYRSWDSRRKMDLTSLSTELEEWYGDKNCYPKIDEVCPSSIDATSCFICGRANGSPQLSNSSRLPCDPQHAEKDYLYQIDNADCPGWYKIYTKLSYPNNRNVYNYGVASPNTTVEPYPL